jgi:hypothetical protein
MSKTQKCAYKFIRLFLVGAIFVGKLYAATILCYKCPLFSCIYTKIIQCQMSGSPFFQKTSIKIIQNIMMQLICRALPDVNSSFLFGRCNCIALTIQLSKNETIYALIVISLCKCFFLHPLL